MRIRGMSVFLQQCESYLLPPQTSTPFLLQFDFTLACMLYFNKGVDDPAEALEDLRVATREDSCQQQYYEIRVIDLRHHPAHGVLRIQWGCRKLNSRARKQ